MDSQDESDDARAPRGVSAAASRQRSNASSRAPRGGAYESDTQDTDEDPDASRMPPPPLPFSRGEFYFEFSSGISSLLRSIHTLI